LAGFFVPDRQYKTIVARGFIPDGLHSSPKDSGAAAQPIGDKSPHHRCIAKLLLCQIEGKKKPAIMLA
jgi:hypothetical protein